MPRRSSTLALSLPARTAGLPAYRALYDALRGGDPLGQAAPGAKLPGSRELARQEGLARGTVVAAFEMLVAEGYVEGSVGSGTFVARTLPDDLLEVARAARRRASGAPSRAAPRLARYARRVRFFSANEPRPVRAFRADLPALDLFPTATLGAAHLAAARARLTRRQLLGCEPLGFAPLREAVADYLATSRGVRATAGQVAIVSGVQEALDLAARLVLDPGDRAASRSRATPPPPSPSKPPARGSAPSRSIARGSCSIAAGSGARGSSTSRRRTSTRSA